MHAAYVRQLSELLMKNEIRVLQEDPLAWDLELGKSGRCACLLVDNCSAHHTTCELKNIGLKFLPANTTAKLQPLDQDIIKSFKVGYRRRHLDSLLVNLRMGTELKVDLLGAIQMLTGAWRDVKTDTVANCFRRQASGRRNLRKPVKTETKSA
ncbi:hypothetical protein HPB48_009833 [Haemaphysalis longicornis]|uniref:DDE-1 domain-containing protein n=1 Tax=Haemaphysalis longicornis TaxID=44386 RepID=A0A9J6FY51_HAELO|nr:hypothetical protein HPB48_009833 [Haemaphysalis longicornis]